MNHIAVSLLTAAAALCFASATCAADSSTPRAAAPATLQAQGGWGGAFLGAFGGHVGGQTTAPVDFDLIGSLAGLDAGINFTLTNGVVAGVVGDFAWSNMADDHVLLPPSAYDVHWFGSLRGRVGLDSGVFMPYLTAGLAFANADLTASDGTDVGSNTHIGWTAGAGVEIKAAENLSVDVLYRYSDYGSKTYGVTDWAFNTNQVTAGVNWHF